MGKYGDGEYYGDEDQENFDHYDGGEHDNMDDGTIDSIPVTMMNRWKQSEISIEQQKINLAILHEAVTQARTDWFWRFRRLDTQVRIICDLYYVMADLAASQD